MISNVLRPCHDERVRDDGVGEMNHLQVVGQLCVDLRPALGTTGIAAPGELAVVGPMHLSMGGAVGNCGRVLADLGVRATLSACIGDDELGVLARRLLGTTHALDLEVVDHATSYTVVVEPDGQDRSFWHHTGANAAFTAGCTVAADRVLHFGYPSLVPGTCADDGAPIARLFERARAAGVATSLDLAFVAENSPVRDVDWPALLRNLLPRTDLFCPSWSDLVSCLGVPADPGREAVAEWADRFRDWGAAAVLITLGDEGSLLRTGSDIDRFAACGIDPAAWANVLQWQVPVPVTDVMTTNGAGDAYKAAFLTRLSEGNDPQDCLAFADLVVARYLTGQPLLD